MRDYLSPRPQRFPGRRKEAKKDGCCVDCGHDIVGNMHPPFSKRRGHDIGHDGETYRVVACSPSKARAAVARILKRENKKVVFTQMTTTVVKKCFYQVLK
jgi:hypothetical protein